MIDFPIGGSCYILCNNFRKFLIYSSGFASTILMKRHQKRPSTWYWFRQRLNERENAVIDHDGTTRNTPFPLHP